MGRTTFYAYFPTKDHLLKELCAELFFPCFLRVAQCGKIS
ncbi:TetR/AcrR family transcriptional regulator [Treponema phagedenis]|uniref:TetR/AcrR family transcriptional regulator n=1 Tax=Treponema phagedenis TaxID=162 RepID=A0AAF1DBB2_TREPH|nr:TetR/AcrR family transcriptional regulator [Treponema phagedenis]QEJ93851.1 TetR/AcrR family transcriptional regulator [Treponema phagedenis]QEJ96609.1 TetR/AcrR family transcriptional regulator [Treponema phagedenis]QEJ99776.1 TetR/AcrR family transcriptional regulator [Treponema phagedenis]QEK02395.1 TetR/AcrR family transcriptional regulator [Treponema phagedenis]